LRRGFEQRTRPGFRTPISVPDQIWGNSSTDRFVYTALADGGDDFQSIITVHNVDVTDFTMDNWTF